MGGSIASGVGWAAGPTEPQQAADRVEGMAPAALPKMDEGARNGVEGDGRNAPGVSADVPPEGRGGPDASKEGNCNLEPGVKPGTGTPASGGRICNFCHAISTPLWRKAKQCGQDIVLCNACGLRYKKGKYCYFCQGIYYEDENKRPVNRQRKPDGKSWIGCAGCQHWCHLDCHVKCSKGGKFSCPKCRRTSGMENAVSSFGEAAVRLTKDCAKKMGHARPDSVDNEDCFQTNGQQMPLPNLMRKRKRLEARKLSSEEVAPKLEKARSWARALNQARDTIIIL